VTSFDADASGPDGFASARVLLATPDGTIRSVADNIAHPNGLAITCSHDLLVTETLGNRLLAFKIDGDGALRHRKVFANFEGMNPLGICEYAEGAVWAAAARGLARWKHHPDTVRKRLPTASSQGLFRLERPPR